MLLQDRYYGIWRGKLALRNLLMINSLHAPATILHIPCTSPLIPPEEAIAPNQSYLLKASEDLLPHKNWESASTSAAPMGRPM